MTSNTYLPSIDQGAKLAFEANFHKLAQQTKSKFLQSGVVKFVPSGGKTYNMARMGRIELAQVDTRNPDKVYSDYALDNRSMQKRRLTRTITIDQKFDINELIADPKSDILMQIDAAKERAIDRIIAEAAVGNVNVGAPDATPTSITAAQDGVISIDATAGYTYATVQAVTESFVNDEIDLSALRGALLSVTGSEHTDLMGEDEFINNDYIGSKPVDTGFVTNAGLYQVAVFAGSVSGGTQVVSPYLPEGSTTRKCLALAPGAVALSMELALSEVARNPNKVNSWDITLDLWIEALRTEGALVKIITTTI